MPESETTSANENTPGDSGAGAPAPVGNGSVDSGGISANTPSIPDWPTQRGWIKDEKIRAAAERFGSVDDAIKATLDLRAKLSDRVRVPSPKSTPEEIADYRKATGVPAEAKAYEIKAPEGIAVSEADMAIIERLKPIFHEGNVSSSTFNKMMGEILTLNANVMQSEEKRLNDYHGEQEASLRKEWGTDFDRNIQMAPRAAAAHGGERFKEFLDNAEIVGGGRLGDHPEMVRFLVNLGRKTDESDMVLRSDAAERDTAKAELERIIQENPVGSQKYLSAPIQKRVQELYRIMYGDESIVGDTLRKT